jgi:hypothetical protein
VRLAALAALLVVAPAAAAAPALKADYSCYLGGAEPIVLTASGFAPGATVSFSALGQTLGTAPADATGTASLQHIAPNHPGGPKRLAPKGVGFTAADAANPQATASVELFIANFTGAFRPRRPRPDRPLTIQLVGFQAGQVIYLHYVHGGKAVRTTALGSATGDCGELKATVRRWPMRRVAAGRWRLQADAQPAYSPTARAQFFTVVLPRAFTR